METILNIQRSDYPSVTTVLQWIKPMTGINTDVLEDKGNIGTEVHKNIYADAHNDFTFFDLYPHRNKEGIIKDDGFGQALWSKRGEGYFKSYQKWKEKNDLQYIVHTNPASRIDGRYYDDYMMLSGQPDALVDICGMKNVLIDFKTSSSPDIMIWSMQAHLYWHLLHCNEIPVYQDSFLWIQLRDNGDFPREVWIKFSEEQLSRCYNSVISWHEEKKCAHFLDW